VHMSVGDVDDLARLSWKYYALLVKHF
jgi:hypothetical protein